MDSSKIFNWEVVIPQAIPPLSNNRLKHDLPLKDEIKLFETIPFILLNQLRKKYYYFCAMNRSTALHNAGLSLTVTREVRHLL